MGRPLQFLIALAGLGLAALARPASAAPGQEHLTPDEAVAVESAIDRLLEEHAIPGLSVAIARDGAQIYAEGFGSAALDGSRPVGPDTRYRIASIAKSLTAVAVYQLVEDSLLELDDPAHLHCPTLPEREPAPTLRHLLAHQSGIRHSTDREDTGIRGAPDRLADAVARIAGERLRFEPGSESLYTSWGYAVLGCVIETVSGRTYFDYLQERVLTPAGMHSTIADRPDLALPDFSPGFRGRRSNLEPAEVVDTRFKMPASGLVSTAPDLTRFATALFDATLLRPDSVGSIFEPQPLRNGEPTNYASGFIAATGPETTGHVYMNGSMEGTTAMLWLIPAQRTAVAILANRERYVRELVPALRAILAALEPADRD